MISNERQEMNPPKQNANDYVCSPMNKCFFLLLRDFSLIAKQFPKMFN